MLAASQWEAARSTDSVYTELKGLVEALATFAMALAGGRVLHCTDNLSTYWMVANAGSRRSARLCVLARQGWLICLLAACSNLQHQCL